MGNLPAFIKVLEKRNAHGKLPSRQMNLSDDRKLIDMKDIENASVPVISQRWSPIQSQCFKLSYTVKKKKVKEIVNMKSTMLEIHFYFYKNKVYKNGYTKIAQKN